MNKRLTVTAILLYVFLTSSTQVRSQDNIAYDTTHNWSWVVPLGKYDYCDIIPINGLIKVGRKVGEYKLGSGINEPIMNDLQYGLLDREGNSLTEIVFGEIFSPNSDGYMRATINEEGGSSRSVLINHLGQILPLPDDAVITLFDRSYSVETADEFIFYVNNQAYPISKSKLEHFVDFTNPVSIHNVYSRCFILSCPNYVYVFNYNGDPMYKTDIYVSVSPQGLTVSYGSEGLGFVDFDGNVIIPASVSYSELYQYSRVPGLFVYVMDRINGNPYKMMDINNPNAFVGLEYSGGYDSPDYENRLLYLSAYKLGEGNFCGMYSFDGKQILPFDCEYIGRCNDGLIRFERGKYTGYVDLDGNMVYEKERYRYAGLTQGGIEIWNKVFTLHDFSEGMAGYNSIDYGSGYINLNFETVIEFSDDWKISMNDSKFHDGLSAVMFRDELVFINRQGEIVIAAEPGQQPWKYSQGFSDGLAAVSAREPVMGGSSLTDGYNYGAVGIISLEISR